MRPPLSHSLHFSQMVQQRLHACLPQRCLPPPHPLHHRKTSNHPKNGFKRVFGVFGVFGFWVFSSVNISTILDWISQKSGCRCEAHFGRGSQPPKKPKKPKTHPFSRVPACWCRDTRVRGTRYEFRLLTWTTEPTARSSVGSHSQSRS